jgi:uncharacterized protein (TIGR02246 family)
MRRISFRARCLAVLIALSPFAQNCLAQVDPVKEPIEAQIKALNEAIARRDAKAVAAMFAPDGEFVDVEGTHFKGQPALEKNFSEDFAQATGEQPELSIDSVGTTGENRAKASGWVAIHTGHSGRSFDRVPVTTVELQFVKQGQQWLITNANETAMPKRIESGNPLQSLGWLIGDWTASNNGVTAKMHAEWTKDKNFIRCNYEIIDKSGKVENTQQVFGYDPRNDSVVSWNFDSTGGFGDAQWLQTNGEWVAESQAVERSGNVSTASNVWRPLDANTITWQSVDRRLDGVPVPDLEPVKLHRVQKVSVSH